MTLGPNYVVEGPFTFTDEHLSHVRERAWGAADEFAKVYKALRWAWGSCGRSYIPDSVAIHRCLMEMLDDVVGRVRKMTRRKLGQRVESYFTGGLHVVVEWMDEEESDEVYPIPEFQFEMVCTRAVYTDEL